MRKKYYMLILLLLLITTSCGNNKDISKYLSDRRNYLDIENFEIIEEIKANEQIIIFSRGAVNKKNTMYFADIIKTSFGGYQWITGCSHINTNGDPEYKNVFSAQLVNENNNLIIYGFTDNNITKVEIEGDSLKKTATIKKINEEENFYYFDIRNITESDFRYLIFNIYYEDDKYVPYYIRDELIKDFLKGKTLYL